MPFVATVHGQHHTVIPAQAGIQVPEQSRAVFLWIPACAGMTAQVSAVLSQTAS